MAAKLIKISLIYKHIVPFLWQKNDVGKFWGSSCEFHLVDILFHVAVVTFQDSFLLVDHRKHGLHRLVVGITLLIIAFHDAVQLVGSFHALLLSHFIVADDVQYDFGGDDRELADLFIGEILVGYFDDAFFADLARGQIVSDGHLHVEVVEIEQANHLIGLVCGDVVNDGAILDGGHLQFFLSHNDSYAGIYDVQSMMVLSFLMSSKVMPRQWQKMASRA